MIEVVTSLVLLWFVLWLSLFLTRVLFGTIDEIGNRLDRWP